jgi:hypothetical protein
MIGAVTGKPMNAERLRALSTVQYYARIMLITRLLHLEVKAV